MRMGHISGGRPNSTPRGLKLCLKYLEQNFVAGGGRSVSGWAAISAQHGLKHCGETLVLSRESRGKRLFSFFPRRDLPPPRRQDVRDVKAVVKRFMSEIIFVSDNCPNIHAVGQPDILGQIFPDLRLPVPKMPVHCLHKLRDLFAGQPVDGALRYAT